jgi:hypothetical protein
METIFFLVLSAFAFIFASFVVWYAIVIPSSLTRENKRKNTDTPSLSLMLWSSGVAVITGLIIFAQIGHFWFIVGGVAVFNFLVLSASAIYKAYLK